MTQSNYYISLAEASEASLRLGINSSSKYRKLRNEDPRLPAQPNIRYCDEWSGWYCFLKIFPPQQRFYKTMFEASCAARRLGLTTVVSYRTNYKLDSSLPSSPVDAYKKEWVGWKEFLGVINEEGKIYSSIIEASEAAGKLGFVTKKQYERGFKQDPKLPRNPEKKYIEEWNGWRTFLRVPDDEVFYSTMAEAMVAVRDLGIVSVSQYRAEHYKDPLLPNWPTRKYATCWPGWNGFLQQVRPTGCYITYEEASNAAKELNFSNATEYWKGCECDPRLPKDPRSEYPLEWKGWRVFLSYEERPSPYVTLEEASFATQRLGIKSFKEYMRRFHEDPRLRSTPHKFYKGTWQNWPTYFGTSKRTIYPTMREAKAAVKRLGFKTRADYCKEYKLDPCLPCEPQRYYVEWVDWQHFLGVVNKNCYSSLGEASVAARAIGLKTQSQYFSRFREDPKLVRNPQRTYVSEWIGWHEFLGTEDKVPKYESLSDASFAAQSLGIRTQTEYANLYREDNRLHSSPSVRYVKEWKGWHDFLGVEEPAPKYKTMQEAILATQHLEITSRRNYLDHHHEDPRLPARPDEIYVEEWKGWPDFFGRINRNEIIYQQYNQAKLSVNSLHLTSKDEYLRRYKQDHRLPANPQLRYMNEWEGWHKFLLPIEYKTLGDVKHATKILGINSSTRYRENYKKYPPMPAHPERIFARDWTSWFNFLDIPTPLEYEEARDLVQSLKLKSKKTYLKYITDSGSLRLSRNPEETYKQDWVNWYVFLGKSEPFTHEYIYEPYTAWAHSIAGFMKIARGGGSKEIGLCRFVRLFVQKYNLGFSPAEFLTNKNIDGNKFKEFVENHVPEGSRRGLWWGVNEFLEYILNAEMTVEDDVTGELITISDARNPIAKIFIEPDQPPNLGESCKPALAFQYVDALKRWIVPQEAKNFSDLSHLHVFDADWVEIDESHTLIDKNDPDCIVKRMNDRLMMWCPVYWMHVFALASVPARGVQLAYTDSGEGDDIYPDIENDQLIWKANNSSLAGVTARQGFVRHYSGDQFGMYFTTNKTDPNGRGYSVPWIPMDLAYWMVKLRKWQQKFNPIVRAMPWVECKLSNLNELQRKNKGRNCFLFRDYKEEEPGRFTNRLTTRLAAGLYHSQPRGFKLAEVTGALHILSRFSSQYTPHSMRVSLITAYILEYGLPIEVVMRISGQTSIVMAIYYVKINSSDLRERFNEGEKKAFKNKAYAAQRMIEQGRIDDLKYELIATDKVLNSLSGDVPIGNYLFRDYGFCPFAGTRCNDGGPIVGKTQVRLPAPFGYLGCQNCLRCRHFVSGPAFMGGLLSTFNEISLQARVQFEHYSELEEKAADIRKKLDKIDEAEYVAQVEGNNFDDAERYEYELKLRKVNSESESAAKKFDVFMCDVQACTTLMNQCVALINSQAENSQETSTTQLIVRSGHELHVAFESVSYFHQLCEVCFNAEVYESASADLALASRSQMIDKMISSNDIMPRMYTLDMRQQLIVGNQFTQLLLSRLKEWEKVDALMDCRISMADLTNEEKITRVEFEQLFNVRLNSLEEEK